MSKRIGRNKLRKIREEMDLLKKEADAQINTQRLEVNDWKARHAALRSDLSRQNSEHSRSIVTKVDVYRNLNRDFFPTTVLDVRAYPPRSLRNSFPSETLSFSQEIDDYEANAVFDLDQYVVDVARTVANLLYDHLKKNSHQAWGIRAQTSR